MFKPSSIVIILITDHAVEHAMFSLSQAPSNPSTNSYTPDVITGQGNLITVGAASSCADGTNAYNVWITNVVATLVNSQLHERDVHDRGRRARHSVRCLCQSRAVIWDQRGTLDVVRPGLSMHHLPSDKFAPDLLPDFGNTPGQPGGELTDAYRVVGLQDRPEQSVFGPRRTAGPAGTCFWA